MWRVIQGADQFQNSFKHRSISGPVDTDAHSCSVRTVCRCGALTADYTPSLYIIWKRGGNNVPGRPCIYMGRPGTYGVAYRGGGQVTVDYTPSFESAIAAAEGDIVEIIEPR